VDIPIDDHLVGFGVPEAVATAVDARAKVDGVPSALVELLQVHILDEGQSLAAKHMEVLEVRLARVPSLIGGGVRDRLGRGDVGDGVGIGDCLSPEFAVQVGMVEHAACQSLEGAIAALSNTIVLRSVGSSALMDDAPGLEHVLEVLAQVFSPIVCVENLELVVGLGVDQLVPLEEDGRDVALPLGEVDPAKASRVIYKGDQEVGASNRSRSDGATDITMHTA
jgi:hypothetical protein